MCCERFRGVTENGNLIVDVLAFPRTFECMRCSALQMLLAVLSITINLLCSGLGPVLFLAVQPLLPTLSLSILDYFSLSVPDLLPISTRAPESPPIHHRRAKEQGQEHVMSLCLRASMR